MAKNITVTRSPHNPLLKPNPELLWEATATFNPSVLVEKLDESISEEDYELSAELRDLLKINEIPTNRIQNNFL